MQLENIVIELQGDGSALIIMIEQSIKNQRQEELVRLNEVRVRVREEGLDPREFPRSETDKMFILNCLRNHFIFYNLSEKELDNVKDSMFLCEMPPGAEVFRQGTVGSCFYIIQKGSVQIRVDDEDTKELKVGDGFGELALLYEIERPSTAITKDPTAFWVIDKVSFRQAVEEIVINEFQSNQKFLEGMAFYQFLRPQQKEKVASSFVTLKYYKGQNIVEEGDPGSSFYIIKDGTASLLQGNLEQRKIYKGESFGHNSLYYNTMRRMTVRAQEDVVCQVLGRETLAKIIGPDFREIMFKNYVKHVVQKNRLLLGLLKKDEETFFEGFKVEYKSAGRYIFNKGKAVEKLIVVMEGKLKKLRSANYLAETGQTWGEAFLNDSLNKMLEDDIIVDTESVLIELNLKNLIAIHATHHSVLDKSEIKRIQSSELDFRGVVVVGEERGSTENTMLLMKHAGKYLMGKLYRKAELEKAGLMEVVRQEMGVTEVAAHPFIPAFYSIYEDSTTLLRITEYVHGECLYDSIREIGLLSTPDTQFYAASLILLLEYFMSQEIVIRDLKPDNFIVDERGYLRLISFGSAKIINQLHRTSTVIGTPHYMAPEIILGKEYNQLVDLWSVGVMLFEFMVGELPFGGNTENPYDIYESIIQGNVEFPRNFKDRRAKKLIETMLSLNPDARYPTSYANLKTNPWFENINWDSLLDKSAESPYRPSKLKEIRHSQNIRLDQYLDNLS